MLMKDRRNQGRWASRGRVVGQVQEPKEEGGAVAEQQREPMVKVGNQVATAIQKMTDILARLVESRVKPLLTNLGTLK